MINYDTAHDPPAAAVPIRVANPIRRRLRRDVSALLDTGTDITAIPAALESELQLYAVSRIRIENVDASVNFVYTYTVRLEIGPLIVPPIQVILTNLDFAIIGRDILSHLYLLLNGPEQTFDLRTTPFLADPSAE
ncbi:MAG: hypothetical protein HY328_07380 [Chloroflexi bacterium]|nr:hypothetical protein [Chloroflexota bacterium]